MTTDEIVVYLRNKHGVKKVKPNKWSKTPFVKLAPPSSNPYANEPYPYCIPSVYYEMK